MIDTSAEACREMCAWLRANIHAERAEEEAALIEALAAERDALRAEVAAREAAAAEAMRPLIDAATFLASTMEHGFVACQTCGSQETTGDMDGVAELVAAVRTLPKAIPAPDALARVRAEAMREGMKRAAEICDESYALSGRQLAACIKAAAQEIKP